jgi:penicillin amidase
MLLLEGWTGKHEWIGFVPTAEMPFALNPSNGAVVSANHKIVNYDHYDHYLGNVFRAGYRAQAIWDALGAQIEAGEAHGVAQAARLQMDVRSIPGELTAPSANS